MPDPSIHPDHAERIERECAEARARACAKLCSEQRRMVTYWTKTAPEIHTTREGEAYCSENVRLHTLMLAALEADRVAGEAG